MSRPATWSFLTNHARVLICIAQDPGVRLRDIGDRVGITERAALRIVGELEDAGYVARRRVGRRSQYTVRADLPLADPLARDQRVGDLLAILAGDARVGDSTSARVGDSTSARVGDQTSARVGDRTSAR